MSDHIPPPTIDRRPLRMAMVGGGLGSFIGPIHRMAAELDGSIRLVCGAFSRTLMGSREAGRRYGIDADRVYADYQELLAAETTRPDGADFVTICTPNNSHLTIAVAALQAGMPVISDKPATSTYAEALELADVVRATGCLYALTHTYTGYPLVREARRLCIEGVLGATRKVVVEYSQGWLSGRVEAEGSKQAIWRVDPATAGDGGCIADIGVHAFNVLEFTTGLRVNELMADLTSIVPGRLLDDDCNILVRLGNGAPGVIHASQVAAGARNGLRVRVWGELGGLYWDQEAPNTLVIDWLSGRSELRHAGADGLSPSARVATRLPAGHPEGYIEAFANLYRDFAAAVRGEPPSDPDAMQTIKSGVRGMAFIDTALRSSRERSWKTVPR